MKTTLQKVTKNNVKVKTLAVIVFLFISLANVNTSFSTLPVSLTTIEAVIASEVLEEGDVSDQEVINYLNSKGYEVLDLEYYQNFDRVSTTQNDYQTIVYVEGGKIVGFEDVQL